jgi:hypothetical protein
MHSAWFSSHTGYLVTVVSYIPVVATVVTCILSLVLARATLRYTEATDKSLQLAREEFEREWMPELHVKLQRKSPSEVDVIVTNLAKASVLLQLLQIRKISHAGPSERLTLNEPLVGGMTWTDSIGARLLAAMGPEFEGAVTAAVTFYAAGRMFRTDWFRFHLLIHNGSILRLEAAALPARRVRVLHDRGRRLPRREAISGLATDVTRAATEAATL